MITTAPALIELRCISCQKRLLDYVNAIREGRVVIRKRCDKCKTMNEIEVKGAGHDPDR